MKKMDLLEKKVSILLSEHISKFSVADDLLKQQEKINGEDSKQSVWVVILTLLKAGVVVMQEADEQMRIFSSEDKARLWLQQNEFFWGRRSFLKYDKDVYEWIHRYDRWDKYISVQVMEVDIDDFDVLEW